MLLFVIACVIGVIVLHPIFKAAKNINDIFKD